MRKTEDDFYTLRLGSNCQNHQVTTSLITKNQLKWALLQKSEHLQGISSVIHLGTKHFAVKNFTLLYLLNYCRY